jgi:predicted nucleic acid-binding protein
MLRTQPDTNVLAWSGKRPSESLFVSAVTQAEMMLGARLLPPGKRRRLLEQAVDTMFREEFAGRVLPFDTLGATSRAAA